MDTAYAARGHIPDDAITELLSLAERPAFKKLLYVPPLNWVLTLGCALSLLAWGGLAYLWLNGEISLFWVLVISTYTFFIFLLTGHEASHLTMARNRVLGDVVATVLTCIPFPQLPIALWRHQHLAHHRETCGKNDPDEVLYGGPILWQMFKVAVHDFYWVYWSFRNRDSAPTSTQWIQLSGAFAYIAILIAGFSSPYWYEFLMIYVIPQRIGFFVAITLFAWVQHPPEKCSPKEVSPFKTTVIMRGLDTPFAKVYFGQNRHLIHHIYPNMPIYRNWKAWQLGKDVFEKQELVNVGIDSDKFNEVSRQNAETRKARFIDAVVDNVDVVADGIKAYTLVPAESGTPFPGFMAGAHIDVEVEPGLIRQYSICNSEEDSNKYVIAVQCEKNGRGGSLSVHETFNPGMQIRIGKPRNLFELKPAKKVLLFAGGIGITPILSMAWTLHNKKVPFELHYSVSSEAKWAFRESWQQLPFSEQTYIHPGDADDDVYDAEQVLRAHKEAEVYVCGPQGFMKYIENSAKKAGMSDEQFNKESFVAGGKPAETKNKSFMLTIEKTDKQYLIPEDKTIAQVLIENNVPVPVICENGICGTCKCKVVSGDVEHRDLVLSDDEKQRQKLFTPCVSRSLSDNLTIQLS